MSITTIQWTDRTWNPVRGCTPISPGCKLCYAMRQAYRFSQKPGSPFHLFAHKVNGHAAWTGKVELIESKLEEPLHWRKPCKVFVNSMSDLFHESLPDEAIDRVFAVMALCPHITFQVLTKRAQRMRRYLTSCHAHGLSKFDDVRKWTHLMSSKMKPETDWPLPNVWLGVSVESRAYLDRIDLLRETPAAIRFVSLEPLLEDLGEINLKGIDWAIIGGESGPGARPFCLNWPRNIIPQCRRDGAVPFMKQVGANPVGSDNGDMHWLADMRDSHGGDQDEWPFDLRVREFPRGTTAESTLPLKDASPNHD